MKRYISGGQVTLMRGLSMVLMTAMMLSWASCKDDIVENGTDHEKESYEGEMICFAAGTTENVIGTRADESTSSTTTGRTYYMPEDYRFVCRMYYKASADASAKFDVTGGSDITVWMKVKGDEGNSLYWRNNYPTLDSSNSALFDGLGNDKEATCLYWQNRKEHAFLAWIDLNKATTNSYSTNNGALKFVPADVQYQKHTGVMETLWVFAGYELFTAGQTNPECESMEDVFTYLATGDNYNTYVKAKLPDGISADDYDDATYFYYNGLSRKYSNKKAETENVDATHEKYGWVQYMIFENKLVYTGNKEGENIEVKKDSDGKPLYLYDKSENKYLAKIEEYDAENPDDRTKWTCYQTNDYGLVKYDEANPKYVYYVKTLRELVTQEVIDIIPANEFDLTHKPGYTSISDQPDVCRALTIQAPLGATQSTNRVNLYFKHQFSLVQVNIKSSDQSVDVGKENIQKVELLGVSEKGYVFTEIDEDGNVLPTTYEPVDISKYTDEHLQNNQFGTSLEMFDMGYGNDKYEYPTGYAKSFNAITFGQLHAIRVTWKEKDNNNENGIVHVSTYRVDDQTLQNLQSGYKYIWNIELRRGTLAIVRTEIVDWIVPVDELEYGGNGTILK